MKIYILKLSVISYIKMSWKKRINLNKMKKMKLKNNL